MRLPLVLFALVVLLAPAAPRAQERVNPVGAWELADADGEKRCVLTLAPERNAVGQALQVGDCAQTFPLATRFAGWAPGRNEALRILDRAGQVVIEFSEVEAGLYEGVRPGDGVFFLQNAGLASASRTVERLVGEWNVLRGGPRPVCTLLLDPAPAGPRHVLRLKPGCDAAITRFQPATWTVEGGRIVIYSQRNEAWTFTEADPATWRRQGGDGPPVQLVRP
jgi:hypothetical protein